MQKRNILNKKLIDSVIQVSIDAGNKVTEIYNSDFEIETKLDSSPVTSADLASHKFIKKRLSEITPKIPILSEEESDIPFKIRSKWSYFWLVDPLDGTKEFINKNGEFTINIALVEDGIPIFGVVHIPVKKETYWGSEGYGSFFIGHKGITKRIKCSNNIKNMRILVSRSHKNEATEDLLKKLKNYKVIRAGSSLKFCLIASGKADCYPRLGPTSEWDTAAGDAVLRHAGGQIVDLNNIDLQYNSKEGFLNNWFIATSNSEVSLKLIQCIKETSQKIN